MRTVVLGTLLAALPLVAGAASTRAHAPQPSSVAQILAQARQALGGETRLSAVTSFVLKGNLISLSHNGGQGVTAFEIDCALPDKFVLIRRDWWGGGFAGSSIGASYQRQAEPIAPGAHTWRRGFNGPRMIADNGGEENEFLRSSSRPRPSSLESQQWLPAARQDFVDVTLGLFATSFAGVPLEFLDAPGTSSGTEITVRDKVSVVMRFDPTTRLPAALGTVEYSNYRDVRGLEVPFRIGRMLRLDDGKLHFAGYEIKDVRMNVPIGKSVFDNK